MADLKYGRLYTEDDVVALLNHEEVSDSTREILISELENGGSETRFPADEPLFLLRAKDASSIDAIVNYRSACARDLASNEHLAGVDDAAEEFLKWRVANPDLVKVAD